MTRITDELLECLSVEQIRNLNRHTFNLTQNLRQLHHNMHEELLENSHPANKLVKSVEVARPNPVLCDDVQLPCDTYVRADEVFSFISETEILLARQDFHAIFLRVRVLIFDRIGFDFMTDHGDLFSALAQIHDQAQIISLYLDSLASSQPMKPRTGHVGLSSDSLRHPMGGVSVAD